MKPRPKTYYPSDERCRFMHAAVRRESAAVSQYAERHHPAVWPSLNRLDIPLFLTTKRPLYFHPAIRPGTRPSICEGEAVLTPAGAKVTIEATYGKRILLHGSAGYCWADLPDLRPLPGA
jgi:hypothetical protein